VLAIAVLHKRPHGYPQPIYDLARPAVRRGPFNTNARCSRRLPAMCEQLEASVITLEHDQRLPDLVAEKIDRVTPAFDSQG